MTREYIVKKAITTIGKLSQNNAKEVADFADFLLQKQEDEEIRKLTYKMVEESEVFDFLHEEEEIYQLSDAKEVFR